MRSELRRYIEQDYWVYGVSEGDFEYTIALTRRIVNATYELVRQEYARVRASNPAQADDIMDDIVAHTVTDSFFVWHSCLWRMQGLLETMIVCTFLNRSNAQGLIGLRAKLLAMREAGFQIDDADWEALMDWGKVRNALSHAPPERYRPGPLKEHDITEYHQLALKLCNDWRRQLASVANGPDA